MSNPRPHAGPTPQVQGPGGGQPDTATEGGEHPATRLPQHPQQQGDDSQQAPEPPQDEADVEDAELRHESAV